LLENWKLLITDKTESSLLEPVTLNLNYSAKTIYLPILMELDIWNRPEDAVSAKSVAVLASTDQSSRKGCTTLDGGPGDSSPTSLDQPLKNLQSDIDAQKGSFNEALALYQAKTAGSKYHIALDFSDLHTWDEALQFVDDASKLYDEVPGA
jgi:hypothetical protein